MPVDVRIKSRANLATVGNKVRTISIGSSFEILKFLTNQPVQVVNPPPSLTSKSAFPLPIKDN
jgi:hypothetical protein